MRGLFNYLNPISRLGKKKYSTVLPLFTTIFTAILLEIYAYFLVNNPNAVGVFAIFIFIALIIYFAFRDGLRGGITTTIITIGYYLYIIYTRHYKADQLKASLETTGFLALLYFILASVIGWLKETIDQFIEREANEKRRLQAIIQQLPVGVIITDEKGKIVQANKKVHTILGTKIPIGFDTTKATLVDSSYNGKPTTRSQSPLLQTLTTGRAVVGREFVINRKDKRKTYIQVSASAIHNTNGNIIAAASIINDITAQKEIEQRKDDFVNMASHELKTPITSMKLYVDSLMNRIKSYNDERASKTINNIKNQIDKLHKLVNDLLDVSRLQTGKLVFTKEDFRIDVLIDEIVEVLQETANNKTIVFSQKSPIEVTADRFRLYQVITNLITNAIKFSPDGKRIIVRVYKQNNKVIVSVQDFGIGIAKEQQNKIFERLYQVNDEKMKTFPGFGMGLYISKEIIKKNKGSIWVESELGKGSTFYFSLPL